MRGMEEGDLKQKLTGPAEAAVLCESSSGAKSCCYKSSALCDNHRCLYEVSASLLC